MRKHRDKIIIFFIGLFLGVTFNYFWYEKELNNNSKYIENLENELDSLIKLNHIQKERYNYEKKIITSKIDSTTKHIERLYLDLEKQKAYIKSLNKKNINYDLNDEQLKEMLNQANQINP